jgi:hypothetical protein
MTAVAQFPPQAHDSARSRDGLTARQLAAIAALVEGKPVAKAAAAAGVLESTLYRWRQDPAFQKALQRAEDAAFAATLAALRRAGAQAVAVCVELMRPAPAAPDARVPARALRLRAAGLVLGHLLKSNEDLDLERRLAALESSAFMKGEKS